MVVLIPRSLPNTGILTLALILSTRDQCTALLLEYIRRCPEILPLFFLPAPFRPQMPAVDMQVGAAPVG